MDQAIRNKLRNVVTQCRKLLEDAVAQVLQGQFGIYATGKKDEVHVDDDAKMKHLSDEDREYRKDILDHLEHVKALGYKPTDSLAQLVREIAFTHLNRFCAYKLMEARSLIRESVSKGLKSQGFLFYLADHEDDEKRANSGQQDVAYRHFLNWLGGTLSEEIGVLFNPHDSANRLYPPQRVLEEVLDLLNDDALTDIWTQDETIGWVYQYFTPKELRDQVRKESQAPRNSYELAFRNQFFTPRYVVEFLTDNTLGRIWYEMRKGDTKLKDQCRYMVRRPTECFLKAGEQPPKDAAEGRDDLSQEELLKLPAHLPHRPKKDPRELKILDPACGSGHFLLYCFDLLLTIYEEAYGDPELGPTLQQDYPTLDALKRDVPRLILAKNLHGIDIDLRASQIAALALWLRCQRVYQEIGLKKDRPKITRSNFVCAEPMPGEPAMLKEFVGQLEPRLLGQLVEVVFDKMKLAGEAGSLLKIEEEIRTVVASAKGQWEAGPVEVQKTLFDRSEPKSKQKRFNLSGVTDEEFFDEAESKVVEALRTYAEKAQNGQRLQRRLFTEDAVRGFAFVDVCHKRFDVVLMNPPFGESSKLAKEIIEKQYPRTKYDLYAAFVEQGINRLNRGGVLGAITSRTGFFLTSFQKWREEILLNDAPPTLFADLGHGVLDTAMVETAAYCLTKGGNSKATTFFRLLHAEDKDTAMCAAIDATNTSASVDGVVNVATTSFSQVPGSPFAYWVSTVVRRMFRELSPFEGECRTVKQGLATADDFRFIRCWWEVPTNKLLATGSGPDWRQSVPDFQKWCREQTFDGKRWIPIAKGGTFAPFFDEPQMVVNWERDGDEIRHFTNKETGKTFSRPQNTDFYFRPGLTWPLRGIRLSAQAVPAGGCFSIAGKLATSDVTDELFPLLGLMNSLAFDYLVGFFAGKVGGVQYEVGLIGKVPVPESTIDKQLSLHSREASRSAAFPSTFDECRHVFVLPRILVGHGDALAERLANHQFQLDANRTQTAERQSRLDEMVFGLYGIESKDRESMEKRVVASADETVDEEDEISDESEMDSGSVVVGFQAVREMLSYLVGSVLGRWDIRFSIGPREMPPLPDPFDPLPVCSPGMLQDSDGQPLTIEPESYPIRIDWDGVLVDDADHQDDIVRRVRDVSEVIWDKRADAVEKEACNILGMKELRDYFRRSGKGGFWDDHISRYSKSRRKAPIYWLLQSSKKNYSLWLYYHRLDKDMFFKALVNYVEPKIRMEASRLDSLRSQKAAAGDTGKAAKKIDAEIEKQEDFISELRDFEDKLRRAANLHLEPDLNDGVVLNIAPLHELVPWKEAKSYWNELLEGKYEWSSIGKQLREKGLVK
jgi:hypothetical protein